LLHAFLGTKNQNAPLEIARLTLSQASEEALSPTQRNYNYLYKIIGKKADGFFCCPSHGTVESTRAFIR